MSPDRTRAAYLVFQHDDLNCTSVHLVDLATAESTELVRDPHMTTRSPAWSPDGGRVAYASEAPGWYEVFVVDVATGARRQVTHASADFSDLSFDCRRRVAARRAHAGRGRAIWCVSTSRPAPSS